jgi:hypothetical protein
MPPTIYIAGSSRDLPRARRAFDLARSLGFVIAYDWIAAIDAADGRANEGLSERLAMTVASSCLDAAVDADVMWCLLDPEHRSPGMHAELGARVYARGRGGLLFSGAGPEVSIYYRGAVHVPADADVEPHLLGHALVRRTA